MDPSADTTCRGLLKWFLLAPIADEAQNTHPVIIAAAQRIRSLFERDYEVIAVRNADLCPSYPPELLVPVGVKGEKTKGKDWTADGLQGLFDRGRLARARTRFPVPVLYLYDGTYVLRSATLSVKGEAVLNGIKDYLFSKPKPSQSLPPLQQGGDPKLERQDSLISRARWEDCKTLRVFGVKTIVDLMKEFRKKKYGLTVTSSERADSFKRYDEFRICGMPYPGTEGFLNMSDWLAMDRIPKWHANQDEDAHLSLAPECLAKATFCDWSSYKKWSLDMLTRNYLKLLMMELASIQDRGPSSHLHVGHPREHALSAPTMQSISPTSSFNSELPLGPPPPVPSRANRPPSPRPPVALPHGGVLVHCISGWDRTPLFVSLLRMLAWAQGMAHQSLDATEMLYTTVGYDWLLFRHRLANRMSKREEVMYGCFMFLSFAALDDTLVFPNAPPFDIAIRREKLLQLNALFMHDWFAIQGSKVA